MKVSTILTTSALATALFGPAIGAPVYRRTCLEGVMCFDQRTEVPYGVTLSLRDDDERQSPTLRSSLGDLPVLGPVLQPLMPLLQSINLSDVDISTQDAQSLTTDQSETLADLECLLLGAVQEVTPGLPADDTIANNTLRGPDLLCSILEDLPIIGPSLRPLLPFLDAIGLSSVDATPGVESTMSLNEDQNAKLAYLKAILEEDMPDIMPNQNTSSPSVTPSDASILADTPAATPTPTPGDSVDEISV